MTAISNPVAVGIGVVVWREHDLKVLLGRRKNVHAAGEWWLPGGKPDAGEHPRDTAVRELHEETGIVAQREDMLPIDLWTYDTFEGDTRHNVTLYYSCETSMEPQLLEPGKCWGWSWCDPGDLPAPHYARLEEVLDAA